MNMSMTWKKWLILGVIGLGVAYHYRPKQTADALNTAMDKSGRATRELASGVGHAVEAAAK
jgi:hypothetical protein